MNQRFIHSIPYALAGGFLSSCHSFFMYLSGHSLFRIPLPLLCPFVSYYCGHFAGAGGIWLFRDQGYSMGLGSVMGCVISYLGFVHCLPKDQVSFKTTESILLMMLLMLGTGLYGVKTGVESEEGTCIPIIRPHSIPK